ncbi:MAG TPA: ATP-binding protein [Spirochaetota bacterium]|nr:ATP-binding protein [Spirochaetota bacterium]
MKTIQHIDSYPADSLIVRRVISVLCDDLRSIHCPQEEIDEIIISMDEALTNAIQETIRTQEGIPVAHADLIRAITVRYLLDDEHFEATIIDHGGGFDPVKSFHDSPSRHAEDYFGQLVRYIDKSESGKLRVTVNERELSLKGIGAGLKILLAFMDRITIDFIDRKDVISDSVTEFTDGTILTISRKRRYR